MYAAMMLTGLAFTFEIAMKVAEPRVMVNRFLTFLPVFANGMMAAHLYVWYAARVRRKAIPSIVGTAAFLAATWLILFLIRRCAISGKSQQMWQMQYRVVLSLVFSVWLLGMAISAKPIRKLFDNRILAAIAAVSYNLYIWHHWVIVHLRESFGAKNGGDIEKMGGGTQWTLTLLGLITAFLIAALVTYLVERPVARRILKIKKEN